VLAHAPRHPGSWLTWDVGQKNAFANPKVDRLDGGFGVCDMVRKCRPCLFEFRYLWTARIQSGCIEVDSIPSDADSGDVRERLQNAGLCSVFGHFCAAVALVLADTCMAAAKNATYAAGCYSAFVVHLSPGFLG